jgi:hypothetical protein
MLEGNLDGSSSEAISIWVSYYRGASWQQAVLDLPADHDQPAQYRAYRPVFFEAGDGILAYELMGMDDDSTTMIFYTTRNGFTWRFQSFVEEVGDVNTRNPMDILSNQEIIFVCGSELCVTRDGAQTWDRISSNLNFDATAHYPRVTSFDFVDGQNGWALVEVEHGSLTMWRTTEGGRNWVKLEPIIIYQQES